MKPRLAALGFAICTGLLSFSALAEGDRPAASVRVDVQMVSVPTAVALRLVPALGDEKTVERAYADVQVMLVRDEATLLGWPVLWMRSGGRSSSETIEEFRYPTEFQPPPDPSRYFKIATIPQKVHPGWGEEVPTSSETRNLGPLLEAKAVVVSGDGKTIDLILTAEFDRPAGMKRYLLQSSPLGIRGLMEQPEFLSARVTTQLRLRSGSPRLLSAFAFQKPEPHVELFIVRVNAAPAGLRAPFPDAP